MRSLCICFTSVVKHSKLCDSKRNGTPKQDRLRTALPFIAEKNSLADEIRKIGCGCSNRKSQVLNEMIGFVLISSLSDLEIRTVNKWRTSRLIFFDEWFKSIDDWFTSHFFNEYFNFFLIVALHFPTITLHFPTISLQLSVTCLVLSRTGLISPTVDLHFCNGWCTPFRHLNYIFRLLIWIFLTIVFSAIIIIFQRLV